MSRHAYWIASVFLAALVLAKFSPRTGFTSLIRFGETWQDRRHSALQSLPIATVPRSSGYDGQFYAQIALDPLLRGSELERDLDAPAYRARRILTPAAAAMLGFGNPWWILQTYALLNVFCWFVLGWLLRACVGNSGWVSFARWTGCMFSMGVLESVRQSLVDLPALLLLSLAVQTEAKSRRSTTALWLALGSLAKESTFLGTVALNAHKLVLKPGRWRALSIVLIAAAPIGLWSLYVHHRFSGASFSAGLGNLSGPFFGLLVEARLCLREVLSANFDGRYAFGLLAIIGFLIQTATLWRKPQFQSSWWRIGAAYSMLLPFLGTWVWSGYWSACRTMLPLTVAFNLLLPGNRNFWPLWIAGNLTLLHAIWRFL